MVELSRRYDFSFFSHWLTDMVGHRGSVEDGVRLLTLFDRVMAGALAEWNDDEGLLIVTSDHGNMEDLSHGKHTENAVPTLIVGSRDGADPDHPLAVAEEYARRIPDARLAVEEEGESPLAWRGGALSREILALIEA